MIHIGADSWIGAGSVVMADVGERATVAAGSVIFRQSSGRCRRRRQSHARIIDERRAEQKG